MRLIIALLISATVCWPAFAKSKKAKRAKPAPKFSGKLLSYSQLMRLSKTKRMAYVKGLGQVLMLMEGFNAKYVTASNSNSQQVREQIAGIMKLMRLFPEAHAAAVVAGVDVSKILPVYDAAKNEWTCPAGATFDYAFRACLVNDKYGLTFHEEKCPAGTQQLSHYLPNTFACISDANWAIIPAARQSGLQSGVFTPPSTLRKEKPERQTGLVLGGAQPAATTEGQTVERGQEQRFRPMPGVNTEGKTDRLPPSDTAAETTPEKTPEQRIDEAFETAQVCTPPVQACKQLSDADRETAITRFRGTAAYEGVDANVCISGGFASTYSSSKKAASTCVIPRVLMSDKNEPMNAKCKEDEALCNPVLFCVGAKPPGSSQLHPITYCVKKTGDRKNRQVTAACAKEFSDFIGHKKKAVGCGSMSAKDCKSVNDSVVQCDPKTDIPSDYAFKKEWDKLVEKTEKLRNVWCGNSDFAALFCSECEIINDRIYKLNKDATNSGCPEQTLASATATPDTAVDTGPAGGRAVKESEMRLDDR